MYKFSQSILSVGYPTVQEQGIAAHIALACAPETDFLIRTGICAHNSRDRRFGQLSKQASKQASKHSLFPEYMSSSLDQRMTGTPFPNDWETIARRVDR